MSIDIHIHRTHRRSKSLSLIPLINVIFLLLIYFVIAGNMDKLDILKVEVPTAESGQELDQGPLLIVLGRYDEVLVNDELVMLDEASGVIREALAKNPTRLISVKADARMAAPKLITMLNRIREAGGENLTLATQAP